MDRRDAATLIPIITAAILPGTIIISDQWAANQGIAAIPNRQYQHITVNHTIHFINPANGACTNTVEGLRNKAKNRNKKQWGTHRTMVDSYMCEFMWRERNNGQDLFNCILRDIALHNPL